MTAFTRSRLTSALPSMAPFGTDRVNNDLVITEGSFAMPMYPPKYRDPIERFFEKVDLEGECWIWRGSLNWSGYGRFFRSRQQPPKMVQAHRYIYEVVYGPIPDGLHIDHLCRTHQCVNPTHLEAVTQRENTLRGNCYGALAVRTNGCIHGHEFTPENTYWRPDGRGRICRSCTQTRHQRYRQERQAAQRGTA